LAGCLDVFSHDPYIPLQGMGCKWTGEIDDKGRKRAGENRMLQRGT
jgi:hypothetical protein